MPQVTVIAHFMHEEEESIASGSLQNQTSTQSYALGTIDDADIPVLEAQGLIVEVVETTPVAVGPQPLRRPSASRDLESLPADPSGADYYQAWFNGPLLEERRQALESLGVSLRERLADGSFVAYIPVDQVETVNALPYVRGLRIYGYVPPTTQPSAARGESARGSRVGREALPLPLPTPVGEIKLYDVRLHRAEDRQSVEQWLMERGVPIVGSGRRKIRIRLAEGSALRPTVDAMTPVDTVDEYILPKFYNDRARVLLGIENQGAGAAVLTQTGAGQIVGVADTGIDEAHPDLANRIAGVVARGRLNDASDLDGHGTHVAGSIVGDGSASGDTVRGTAPHARLFFQSVMDAVGELSGLPVDLNDLFDEAYQAGARIHNNSWGSKTASRYVANSLELDEFVADHRDMLIVVAAGNEGSAAAPVNARRGYVDWLSVSSPASAKNALTVGASRSDRTQGGLAELTWKEFQKNEYPHSPIAGEKTSGDPERLAAFSSRGPCDDLRIKPDLVAPGTNILSTRSAIAPDENFWGNYAQDDHYAFLGGTSMATPLVSGCAALVREYYQTEHGHDPSAALLKATLINSTRWLHGKDALADHKMMPNYHQGFGCLYMPWAIPNPHEPQLQLDFWDRWQQPAMPLTWTGERERLQFAVAGHYPLRICLVWTDFPGRALQNDLDLFLEYWVNGQKQKWIGNAEARRLVRSPDRENTVEVIRLDKPEPGNYLIQVAAHNILHGPQDFALVVTGDLTAPLVPYLGS